MVVVLFMHFSEPITFVDRPEVESVKENEEAIIKCMVTGVPEPTSMYIVMVVAVAVKCFFILEFSRAFLFCRSFFV